MGVNPEAAALIAVLSRLNHTVATAESLTAGLVSATLANISGASAVLLGGIVAYDPDVKQRILGVDEHLLATHGAVHADVARQMALAATRLLRADLGLATTGVAGPDPVGEHPPGTGFIALALPGGVTLARPFSLPGTRNEVRTRVVKAILTWAAAEMHR